MAVWAMDELLIVSDQSVSMGHRADLVSTATSRTGSIHAGRSSTEAVAGNGSQLQLPGCRPAGFSEGDDTYVHAHPGVLLIHDGSQGGLIDTFASKRDEQVSSYY